MAIRILLWVLISLFSAIVLRFLSIVIQGRKNIKRAVGFFHPYTNDGGGGERVLWCAVKAIQEESPNLYCVVYTGDHDASPESLTTRAIDRFGVKLLHPPQVVHLYKRKWIEEGTYPHFTMVGQSFGSVYLAWEALCKLTPLVYFDTSGYAFTYPLARMFGCNVICYTHYPTISLDMLSRVRQRNMMYNNDALVARSIWLSRCKLVYYTIFSWMYGFVGSFTHLAMVNSSWTQSHIVKLWKIPGRTKRVYPPCDTSGLQALPLERQVTTPTIISVAQFRPEKAHTLQLEAFSIAVKNLDANSPRPKLQFVGSCRNKEDDDRLQKLKDRAIELEIDRDVEFYKNVMYRDLVRLLGGATAGIHSMIDEHFGISVVEYMAAGAIPIAHNSAGPQLDIVLEEDGKKTGFLARTVEEYADAILQLLRMPETERLKMAAAARKRASRFSEQRFYEDYKAAYMGCHIDGFIAVVGHPHVLQEGTVTGRAADVIAAANTAAEVALRLVRPGKKNKDVTEAIQKVAAAYDCKIVEGVLSHQLKQFVIDGNKVILSVANPDTRVEDAEFEENEVYAIDIVTSTGDGKPRLLDEKQTTIYKRAVDKNYHLKMKASRFIFSEINQKFPIMPFTARALEEKRARLGLVECVNHDLLQPYPVLHEKPGDFVAHFKFTVLLMPNGSDRITSHAVQELQPTKTIDEEPEIKAWLALATKKKKGGGKKKKAKKGDKAEESTDAQPMDETSNDAAATAAPSQE